MKDIELRVRLRSPRIGFNAACGAIILDEHLIERCVGRTNPCCKGDCSLGSIASTIHVIHAQLRHDVRNGRQQPQITPLHHDAHHFCEQSGNKERVRIRRNDRIQLLREVGIAGLEGLHR